CIDAAAGRRFTHAVTKAEGHRSQVTAAYALRCLRRESNTTLFLSRPRRSREYLCLLVSGKSLGAFAEAEGGEGLPLVGSDQLPKPSQRSCVSIVVKKGDRVISEPEKFPAISRSPPVM